MPDVWPPGTATGLGPFPGTDPLEAARIVFAELGDPPGLPFLPELPARGVGADPVGRTAALLAGLHVEVGTGTWRFVTRPGRDEQRARTALTTDLDALEEAVQGYAGPAKLRLVGPWTLARAIEPANGAEALAGVWIGATTFDGALLRAAGAGFVGLDGAVLDSIDEDEIGEAIDAGLGLLVACVPLDDPRSDPRPVTEPVRSLWRRVGFALDELPTTVALAPVEGLEQLDRAA